MRSIRDSTVVVGRNNEESVVRWLIRHHWKIVGRNLRTPYGEIDILATKEKRLILVEVKTVKSFEDLEQSIRTPQRLRLERIRVYLENQSRFSVRLVLALVLRGNNESSDPRFYPFPLHNLEVSWYDTSLIIQDSCSRLDALQFTNTRVRSSVVEQGPFKPCVVGSIPTGPTVRDQSHSNPLKLLKPQPIKSNTLFKNVCLPRNTALDIYTPQGVF